MQKYAKHIYTYTKQIKHIYKLYNTYNTIYIYMNIYIKHIQAMQKHHTKNIKQYKPYKKQIKIQRIRNEYIKIQSNIQSISKTYTTIYKNKSMQRYSKIQNTYKNI